jgi:hypothetical protein
MKERVTLTLDPDVVAQAKQLAFARKTNFSALVEELLRNAAGAPQEDIVNKWSGKFRAAESDKSDAKLLALRAKYKLDR